MKRVIFVVSFVFLVNLVCIAQERANASTYKEKANATTYGDETKPVLSTGNLFGSQSKDVMDVYFLEATVLMNLKADEYVASFGVGGEAETSLKSENLVDSKIEKFKTSLSSIGISETFVDFINQAPYYEFDSTGKTATEKLKGYKTAKNVLLRFKDRNLLGQITKLANTAGIYDFIKLDFIVKDFAGIKTKMMGEAIKIIKSKEQTYSGLGITLKPAGIANEKYTTFSPDQLYQDYQAFESGSASGYRKTIEKSKNSTSYYSGFDGKDFDLTINSITLEPNIQAVLYLRVKYLPTVVPDVKCCSETNPK